MLCTYIKRHREQLHIVLHWRRELRHTVTHNSIKNYTWIFDQAKENVGLWSGLLKQRRFPVKQISARSTQAFVTTAKPLHRMFSLQSKNTYWQTEIDSRELQHLADGFVAWPAAGILSKWESLTMWILCLAFFFSGNFKIMNDGFNSDISNSSSAYSYNRWLVCCAAQESREVITVSCDTGCSG